MDTSNSTFDFYLADLADSRHDEDHCLLTKCEEVLAAIVDQLIPTLKYVAQPRKVVNKSGGTPYGKRLLGTLAKSRQSKSAHLYLDEGGVFHTFSAAENGCLREMPAIAPKRHVIYSELLEALKKTLEEAGEKRQKHLQSIQSKTEMLDDVLVGLGIKKRR